MNNIENERYFDEMTKPEKKFVYRVAIASGDVRDTFNGFCKSMSNSLFNIKTGEPIEIG